ncbi:MAG: hydantoinase B/oxoprolinase family protein, partial [Candidatus Binatia bacterium]|nr:hydantoinase B/oxoprolinase family protein [Candidatus Binatia bacterium]
HKVYAAGEGGINLLVYTPQVQDGVPPMLLDMYSSGWGARPTMDGVEGVTPMAAGGATRSLPAEMIERECPVLIEGFGFVPETGGAGRFRGAMAVYRTWRFLQGGRVLLRTCRVKSVPYGLAGGKDGTPFQALLSTNGTHTELPPRMLLDIPVQAGAVLLHVQPGAGGYGDPFLRDPEKVLADVLDEKISPAYAEREYGVVVDVVAGQVDTERTAAVRRARRNQDAGREGA